MTEVWPINDDEDEDLLEGLGKSRRQRDKPAKQMPEPMTPEEQDEFVRKARERGAHDDGDELR